MENSHINYISSIKSSTIPNIAITFLTACKVLRLMCDWIKWGEIESAEMSHHDAFYIIITVSIFMFLSLIIIDAQNAASYFGLAIGLFGILIAAHSIQSSTRQLIEMEVDYWNARGIDHNNKGAELRKKSEYDQAAWAYEDAIEAFDKASKLDPLSAKNWSNRGNALVDRGKYDEAINLISDDFLPTSLVSRRVESPL